MPGFTTGRHRRGGFSLLEVTVVVAIGLMITAIGLPRITNVVANMKIRASLTTVSGFLQNVRMLAVKKNRTMTARHFNRSANPYSLVYYTKEAPDSSSITTTDSQVEMEAPIITYDTPSGTGAPPAITNSALGLGADPLTTNPSFNSRGLPCAYSSGVCANAAFIKYFKDNRIGGSGGWAAISMTPAGRIKRWFWNGSIWTD
jgi:prepilin-type N-terminal cleavage/methylation domain-containing protein